MDIKVLSDLVIMERFMEAQLDCGEEKINNASRQRYLGTSNVCVLRCDENVRIFF